MNVITRTLLIVITLFGAWPASLSKASDQQSATILSEQEMSRIRGGLCNFEMCEDAPGTGICQPEPDDDKTLCQMTSCKFKSTLVGLVEVIQCFFSGPNTCTESKTYRQCVWDLAPNTCQDSPDTTFCGTQVYTTCHPIASEGTCICQVLRPKTPCDWTYCTP
jgi:hypothetical protein